jgi:hypothetical protein
VTSDHINLAENGMVAAVPLAEAKAYGGERKNSEVQKG